MIKGRETVAWRYDEHLFIERILKSMDVLPAPRPGLIGGGGFWYERRHSLQEAGLRKDVVVLLYLTAWVVMLAGGIYFSLVETAHHPIEVLSDFSSQHRLVPAASH